MEFSGAPVGFGSTFMRTTEKKQKHRNLAISLTGLSVVPLLILGVVSILMTSFFVYNSMRGEVKAGLKVLTESSCELYDLLYPGDYGITDGEVVKGDMAVGSRVSITDYVKEISGADATLFYGDTRVLTSICSADGSRAVGTKADEVVVEHVLKRGEVYFSDRVMVNGTAYFGYYEPLRNSDGSVVGMMFAGRPRSQVMEKVGESIHRISCVILVVLAATGLASLLYGRRIIFSIHKTEEFLGKVAGGDITADIDPYLLRRTDELGEMGRFAKQLQASIIDLVGRDPLTCMYNRRSCNAALENAMEEYRRRGSYFSIAIGDIDHFKWVNDTFGHQAGDTILKKLAMILTAHMERRGFVFRWGGEEFLFIYEGMDKKEAGEALAELQKDIHTGGLICEGQPVQAAMTFGLADCREAEDLDSLIHLADERMYCGKKSGRDRIVTGP